MAGAAATAGAQHRPAVPADAQGVCSQAAPPVVAPRARGTDMLVVCRSLVASAQLTSYFKLYFFPAVGVAQLRWYKSDRYTALCTVQL